MAKKLNKKNQARLENWLTGAQKSIQTGNYPLAETFCNKILKLQPGNITAHQHLGDITYNSKRYAEAVEHLTVLLNHHPDDILYCRIGLAHAAQKDYKSAFHAYHQALKLNSRAFQAYNNLGLAFVKMGKINEAIKAFANALNINKNYAEAHFNVATQLEVIGKFKEAVSHYRLALELNSRFRPVYSRILYLQSRYCLCDASELLEQHKAWDQSHHVNLMASTWQNVTDPNPDRQLRIGYVSSVLHQHEIGAFIEPLLTFHSKNNVESYCYTQLTYSSTLSDRLESLCDFWRTTQKLSDIEMERLIRKDKIDILISLDGHNPGNRLSVFTRRPAPIMASYLGYRSSTGLEAMDYWIGDEINLSTESQEFASEKIYRLPRCFICYQPPKNAPEISNRELDRKGVVFGALTNIVDISAIDIQLWSEILKSMDNATLLIKSNTLELPVIHENLLQQFNLMGIDTSRITIKCNPSDSEKFDCYNEMDIVLDTSCDSAISRVCDALWMGLPVFTLKGNQYAQSLTASILMAIGYDEWVTASKQEFVSKVVDLARKPSLLFKLRNAQRQKIAQSELFNAFGLTHSLEQAYRKMWIDYLAQLQQDVPNLQSSVKYATV